MHVNLCQPASLQHLHEFGHLMALIKALRLIQLVKDSLRRQPVGGASFRFKQGQRD